MEKRNSPHAFNKKNFQNTNFVTKTTRIRLKDALAPSPTMDALRRVSLSKGLHTLSKLCMDATVTDDDCAAELERRLDEARTEIRAMRSASVPRLPPELIAVVWRWLDARGAEAFALCDRAAFDVVFASYHGCTRAAHMAHARCSRDKRRKNEEWIQNKLRSHFAASADALVIYGVGGSVDLDEIVDMDVSFHKQRLKIFVIFERVENIQIPLLEGIDRFSWLCIARCALIARKRTPPFERSGVLRIMGTRPIWWTELTPCATLRL